MKIEKIKEKMKKLLNRIISLALPVSILTMSCGTNALVVRAASDDNSVSFISYTYGEDSTVQIVGTIPIEAGGELVAELYNVKGDCYTLTFRFIKNGEIVSDYFDNLSVTQIADNKSGHSETVLKGSYMFTGLSYTGTYTSTIKSTAFVVTKGNLKVFKSHQDFEEYKNNGGGNYDIVKPDTIDDGVKDPDIGYLHNLQRNSLQSGKQDENGIYEKYSARFTWDDTYPEYDSSYLVEVRGKCAVQTRGFLGFGKTKNYTSDIKNIAKDISYKDLEWIISSQDQYAPFNSFINEHMPTNLVMTGVYGMRDYYFRIYKWSDTDECYHYGPWVNMHYIDDDLWISNVQESTVGDFDDNGNFIVNPDSDYGTGTKKSDGVGVGDTEEDAKKDNDRREEEKKNDDGKLDLSNASISDIWYWFVTSLSNLYNSLGFIPEFFQKIFSFLPTPIYVFLGIGIVVAILLRVLGR